ncbi:response regulator transcription factor [Achromobacter xylosoxidans]|jgi:two-component system response regulator TctD|uniref:Response regulator transcription factor n=1 Tax=Alcaligenes xylosoxydans xylosoxydans TaxID=85698 RepID=A0A9X3KYL9_ALCXX|nr:response regulator transcription factor [Achromobacter xylosoxidans]MCZ8402642.1 response regulator transcription factor [Achromobacter xylosoxidans]MCZ8436943.1 response regulator transcription factor [Achromobacter xylosoxidans]CUJ50740.1 Mycobacterial persistence regulator A [Achromobacter xylosoxidans]CUJ51090.1 Mycobacterial persistence regulator A [Achromobacter xylosoxidans]CUK19258.1 Mycobacterial persistence regulator A [Achromobacter xylosoxidans]
MRILVIEDDEDLADALVRRLRRLGHAVDCQKDGLSADGVLQYETFDLVILDIGLPRMSGFEILHRLRDRGSKTPVLALTARIDIEDRVHALDTGADDYLAKPFDFRELEARCRALLRRPSVQAAGVLRFGDLVIDSAARQVSLAGQRIDLPKREYSLLEILLGGMNRAVSKAEIANKLFAFDDDAAPNAIEVYIARLRRKLEGSPLRIETQRGTGYLLKAVEDADADAAPRD